MDKIIYLCIAGHGPGKDGSFDPGATGFIKKGEYRYMKENLFPAMKKYADEKFIFFDEYNVYSYRNIVALVRSYGINVVVIEFHFDATGSAQASGGHVIVYSHYKPDAMDLRLRDAIKSMVGVRYDHAGEVGISGRTNLFNVRKAASGGINYRLVELGFGTNAKDADILMNQTDQYAKKLVEAIKGAKVGKVSTSLPPIKPVKPQSTPKPTGELLHLPTSAKTWRIYNPGGPYTTKHAIHKLTPSAFGGLTYEIKGNPAPNVYLIDTGVKGRVAIYAHTGTGASFSKKAPASKPELAQKPKPKGRKLHLPASAKTWRIYNVNGPYTTKHAIHKLTPSAFGGITYDILGDKGNHVYIINTGVKGRVAIYAAPSTGAIIN